MRIRCTTTFDITTTGVKGNFNKNRVPFTDAAGCLVEDQASWSRSRNQQRNWETINQILSLRVLPINITLPEKHDRAWTFEFEVEQPAGLESNGDPLGELKSDCRDVPMITGLDESPGISSMLMVGVNIDFDMVNDK